MNTKLLPTLALVSAFFITGPSFAEEKEVENKSVKSTISINQPRDAASGLPTGKRIHKPVNIKSGIDKASPLSSQIHNGQPARAISGLPTGKRQHKPVRLNKELDKSSPMIGKAAYRKCPDGSMINPGEKCPVKAVRAGYRLCPDGNTMVTHGQKCPEKATRAIQPK